MAVLINGNGNEAIYAQQDADWYAALMGGITMITAVGEQFAYELLDANTIGVKDGVIITKEGRRIQVDTNVIDTFDIPTGAQGTTNYYIIGYHLVTDEQSVQTAETFVQLMENGTDTIPEGSFKEGDDDVYVSLYRVEQNDLTIGTITLLLPTVSDSMQQQISQIKTDLSDRAIVKCKIIQCTSQQATITYDNELPKAILIYGVVATGGQGSIYYRVQGILKIENGDLPYPYYDCVYGTTPINMYSLTAILSNNVLTLPLGTNAFNGKSITVVEIY